MKNFRLNNKFYAFKLSFHKSISKVSKENNKVDWSKEEVILERLQRKLGKPKDEVRKMMSDSLLNLLTMVPFNTDKEIL